MKRAEQIAFVVLAILTICVFFMIMSKQSEGDIRFGVMDGLIMFITVAPVVVLQFELFNVCMYGVSKPKDKRLGFFKISSAVVALLLCCSIVLCFYLPPNALEIIPCFIFALYVLLKVSGSAYKRRLESEQEDMDEN